MIAKPIRIEKNDVAGEVSLEYKCPFCGTRTEIVISADGYNKIRYGGMHVQDALPELGADEREVLISGICLKCQTEVFN